MPNFEFSCKNGCGKFEAFRRFDELDEVRCPACRGEVERIWSPFNFTFGFRLSEESHKRYHKDSLVRNV